MMAFHHPQMHGLSFLIPHERLPAFVIPGERSETRNPETTFVHAAAANAFPGSRIARCAGFRDD